MTIEELKARTRNIALNHMLFDEPMHGYDAALDELIITLSIQLETQYKEALAAQGEAWKKEVTRQVNSALECGRVEGAEKERERLRVLEDGSPDVEAISRLVDDILADDDEDSTKE